MGGIEIVDHCPPVRHPNGSKSGGVSRRKIVVPPKIKVGEPKRESLIAASVKTLGGKYLVLMDGWDLDGTASIYGVSVSGIPDLLSNNLCAQYVDIVDAIFRPDILEMPDGQPTNCGWDTTPRPLSSAKRIM